MFDGRNRWPHLQTARETDNALSLTNFVLGMSNKRPRRHSNTTQIQNFVKRVLTPAAIELTSEQYRQLSAKYALKLSLDRD
jgi:hypothetical protein